MRNPRVLSGAQVAGAERRVGLPAILKPGGRRWLLQAELSDLPVRLVRSVADPVACGGSGSSRRSGVDQGARMGYFSASSGIQAALPRATTTSLCNNYSDEISMIIRPKRSEATAR